MEDTLDPGPNQAAAIGREAVFAGDELKFDVGGYLAEAGFESDGGGSREEFVIIAGDMKDGGGDYGGGLPVFGDAATEAEGGVDEAGVGGEEAIVEADRLGEAEEQDGQGRELSEYIQ